MRGLEFCCFSCGDLVELRDRRQHGLLTRAERIERDKLGGLPLVQSASLLLEGGDERGVCRFRLCDQLALGRIVGGKAFRRRVEALCFRVDLFLGLGDAEEVLVCGFALAPEMGGRLLLVELFLVCESLEPCVVERELRSARWKE